MSDTMLESVRSLLLPLQGGQMLVLPNAAVAEVVSYRNPSQIEGADPWLLGTVPWRSQTLPLVAFEALGGEPVEPARRGAQLVVLHGITAPERLPYYALLVSAIPHLIQVAADSMHAVGVEDGAAHVLCNVAFGEQRVAIPNLDAIEAQLQQVLGD